MKKIVNILNFNEKKSKFFHKSKIIDLYLGPWCLAKRDLYKNKNKNYINVYDYSNKDTYLNEAENLNKIYEFFLEQIVINLNKIHNLNFKKTEWEIILGRWLMTWINHVHFHWVYVEKIFQEYKIKKIYSYKYKSENFIPTNTWLSHLNLRNKNEWSEHIFQEILKFKNYYKYNEIIGFSKSKNINSKKKFLRIPIGLFYRRRERFIFYNLSISIINKIKLKLKYFNFGITVYKNIKLKNQNINRDSLIFPKTKDKFITFLSQQIKYALPRSFMENFQHIQQLVLSSHFPKKIDFILTSYAQYYDEFFKIYVANLVNKNPKTQLCLLQHGYGGIFVAEDFYNIYLDKKISNIFLSWGNLKKKNHYPFCYPLAASNEISKFSDKKGILILSYSFQYLLMSPINGTINGIEIDEILFKKLKKFYDNLLENIQEKVYVKTQAINKLNNFNYSLKKNLNVKLIESEVKFLKIYKNYNLIIHTFVGTGFFECLIKNIPFILIYSEKCHLPFDNRFKDYLKKMKRKNIMFDNEEKASKFINKNYYEIINWWKSEDIQELVNKMSNDYCKKKNIINSFDKLIKNR